MGTLKQLLTDSLNGFAAADIPLFLFQLTSAGILGFAIGWVLNKKLNNSDGSFKLFPLLAIGIALIAVLGKISFVFAILIVGCLLYFKPKKDLDNPAERLGYILLVVSGVGCGIGSVIITILGIFFALALTLIVPKDSLNK